MNKKILGLSIFFCLALMAYAYTGGEEKPEKAILGTWEAQNLAHESILTFNKDKTMVDVIPKDPMLNAMLKSMLNTEMGGTFKGTYAIKKDELTTTVSDTEGTLQNFTVKYKFKIKGKKLSMNDGFKVIEYRKIK